MRKIVLKNEDGFDYKTILRGLLSVPSRKEDGLSLEEVRRSVKLLDKLDSAEHSILLEESDWSFVKGKVSGARYTLADKRIVEFADAILCAQEVSVSEAS